MSQDPQSAGELFTRREAAKRHNCSHETIRYWHRQGWLTPAAKSPYRYTAEALDAAATKAKEARRQGSQKGSQTLLAKAHDYDGPDRMLQRDAAERLKASLSTIKKWRRTCPYLPDRRGIKCWGENGSNVPVYVATADIETIESKINGDAKATANRRLRSFRQKHIAAVSKGPPQRWPDKEQEQGNSRDAAGWAGLSRRAIENAVKNGELKAVSKKPLRFDRDVVKKFAARQEKREDDLSIADILAKLLGPPGKINKSGQSQKLARVYYIFGKLKIETYERREPDKRNASRKTVCIARGRFSEIESEYLAITNGVADEMQPGETKIRDAAREFGHSRMMLVRRLAKHAPAAVRTVKFKGRNGARYTAEVAPRAAIEAALRGENWMLPPETTDAPPEQSNGQNSPPADPSQTVATPTRDETAYRPMSELWAEKERFSSSGACSKFLDSHKDEIDWYKPSERRRMVHVGQWYAYWAKHDDNEFGRLDKEPSDATKEEIQRRAELERSRRKPPG